MRILFFICSVATHCLFLLLAVAGSSQERRILPPRILSAELVSLAPEDTAPPKDIRDLVLPEPAQPEPAQQEEPTPAPEELRESPPAPTPPPPDAPQPETPQTDAAPQEPLPATPSLPAGTETVAPGETAISTRAEAGATRPVIRRDTEDVTAFAGKPLVLRQGYRLQLDNGDEVTLKRGAEFRSLRMLAVREYTIDEYVGHYQIDDHRFVSIVDARGSHGTMLFMDPATHMVRKLKKFGNMIYTYGPSFDEDQPVKGTITFLTSKEHTEAVKAPSRILWDPEKPPALLGTKIYFREKRMELDTTDGPVAAELVAPEGDGPYPGLVLVNGDSCAPPRVFRGLARQLAVRGMAVLVPEVRGCGGTATEGASITAQTLVSDARLWFSVFSKLPFVNDTRTGYWGRENGLGIVLRAAVLTAEQPSFLFCSSTQRADVRQVAPLPEQALLSYEGKISWLFSGVSPKSYWKAFADALGKRSGSTTSIRYLKTDNPDLDLAMWLQDVGPDCVEEIGQLVESNIESNGD